MLIDLILIIAMPNVILSLKVKERIHQSTLLSNLRPIYSHCNIDMDEIECLMCFSTGVKNQAVHTASISTLFFFTFDVCCISFTYSSKYIL